MPHRRRLFLPLLLLVAVAFAPGRAPAEKRGPEGPDKKVDAATRKKVIAAVVDALKTKYVFPDVGEKMADALRKRQAEGGYDKITSSRKLAETLTSELQAISHDKHLHVDYFAEKMPVRSDKGPSAEEQARFEKFAEQMNYGFQKVERLQGNVGYLKLDAFMQAGMVGETASAAMTLLAGTDALIIDLRENGGGDPATVALITSYLYGEEPVHLNDIYDRPADSTTQYWTHAWVPGRRFGPDKPVYVLTSAGTFSAAEEFTYNLQNLKRATIVGETTGGGAHPGEGVRLADHFGVFLPTGRAINPVSKTNWEGTGVVPDVKIGAPAAFDTAYVAALEGIIAAEKDKQRKAHLQELLVELRAGKK